jgi:hypothetical protein
MEMPIPEPELWLDYPCDMCRRPGAIKFWKLAAVVPLEEGPYASIGHYCSRQCAEEDLPATRADAEHLGAWVDEGERYAWQRLVVAYPDPVPFEPGYTHPGLYDVF